MPKPSIQVLTLGCSKNTVDTEHLLFQAGEGFDVIPAESRPDHVDYLLVNTCGFIGDAKEESIQAVLEAGQRRQRGEAGKLIVFGCLSQRYPDELPGLIPEVDEWYGARDLTPVLKAIGAVPSPERRCGRIRTEGRIGTAFLKISEGCDRSCAYCAIPGIRGAHRSVPLDELVSEARFLAAQGVRELVVIAQDTTYYGLDLYRRRALAELLQRLSEVEGIEWIRIHYSYPSGFPRDVLAQMASNPKVCPYLDIPLQHISDKVLSMMHRHCTGDETRALIRDLRARVPGVVLRTTMIVGHPGEGEKEFGELLDFVREARFERLGAFTYSEEEGTYGAAHYEDDVPPEIKEERLSRLMELQREISLDFNRSRVGSVERVLVDAYDGDTLVCRSRYESPDVDGEILVRYEAEAFGSLVPSEICGRFIDVRIVGADEYDLIAEIVKS